METLSSSKAQSWLIWFLNGLLILGFFIIIGRLVELQIVKGAYFKNLAEGNRIRRVPIVAPRGKIYARGGEMLVGNNEVKKQIVFHPEKGYEKIEDISEADDDEIISEWERSYLVGGVAAHVTGYLGEVNEEEVGTINPNCPEKGPRVQGSLVGRSGLEEKYECVLSGINGEELVEVDSMGDRIRTLGKKEPVAGADLKTNIHYGLQEKIAEIIANSEDIPEDKKAAVVVTDTHGEVLALYSSPSFDPNIFINQENQKIHTLLQDNNLPLYNRVIGGKYHPGSVFKPIVAIAALQEGTIDENYRYQDEGQITIDTLYGKFTYSNWYFSQYGGREGEIDVIRAIKRSTDTFFYKVGELLGIENIEKWANTFGLNRETGIDIPGEIVGLVPSPQWKEEVKGERWFLGNTYHISIGQGDIALTPIGLNTAISAISSRGNLCNPNIVGSTKCTDLKLDDNSVDLVISGMQQACQSGGTGYTFFDFEREVACKTGTAETQELDKTHAWFTVFGPLDYPEIIATVLVEKGGEGSSVAGPIAREIFNFWFDKNKE